MNRGATVVVTLSSGTLDRLEERLTSKGLYACRMPLLSFTSPRDWSPVDRAIEDLDTFASVVFTSPRAASAFGERHRRLGGPPPRRGVRVWATGRRTATLARRLFPTTDIQTPGGNMGTLGAAEALGKLMLAGGIEAPVLFPCGERHRDVLPRLLAEHGVEVAEVVCYRTIAAPEDTADAALAAADLLVVGSPHIARRLAGKLRSTRRPPGMIALGATTGRSARQAGWPAVTVAPTPTIEGVMEAVERWSPRAEADTQGE